MKYDLLTNLEKGFITEDTFSCQHAKIPYIVVDSFPKLGLLTAMRFLEWVAANPQGVISLPTGKTPEYFIKWTKHLLDNWDTPQVKSLRQKYYLPDKPDLSQLRFVQIDEFYPISSSQKNSFNYYDRAFYLKDFGLNPDNALLINCDEIKLAGNRHFSEVFPDNKVDLSLRYRNARNNTELIQQESIFKIDNWCSEYERKIRAMGGIGFFLGGIGPDGHIAFNTRGSDHFSTTRLTETNFETQAVAAGDLGGIAVSRNRLVITIGLETITYNPDAVAIIFAASEAKSDVVKNALENDMDVKYPATVLQKLKNGRFYITKGAAVSLNDSINEFFHSGAWDDNKTEKAVLQLCKKLNKYGSHITTDDLKNDEYCRLIPDLSDKTVEHVINRIIQKIDLGKKAETNQVFLHTGPHHDDIMLGIMPHVNRQLRSATNVSHFAVLTSGFTAVTNSFVIEALEEVLNFLDAEQIQMVKYPDFFESGYQFKWDKDVYHYLNKVASGEPVERRRGFCHRLVRAFTAVYGVSTEADLRQKIGETLRILQNSYDGEKNPPEIQKLKGMIREFEEELVWAHFGVQVKNVHHLRLGFYTGDIFTEQPDKQRDVQPILQMLRELKPTVISLALDPEGSGPDTHYKVMQAIAEAVKLWSNETDTSNLRIWGYRNVWFRFQSSEAEVIIPVSMNALALLDKSFTDCYLSQVDAPFPSYQYDGKFSYLTQKIWVDQLKEIQLLLGKDYFYQNEHPLIRATHGLIYMKEMNVQEFLSHARELEKSMEGSI
ncbi:MAG: 6-phosphogluconolactonase/glucosamine-6-phosphate isomerase/deaminase [Bacteroidetes bacterium]|nr:6-phosphogluconolactonase/glucosamine-6-phosphate isomerase/deaminase [Bacteroidota bacterium]